MRNWSPSDTVSCPSRLEPSEFTQFVSIFMVGVLHFAVVFQFYQIWCCVLVWWGIQLLQIVSCMVLTLTCCSILRRCDAHFYSDFATGAGVWGVASLIERIVDWMWVFGNDKTVTNVRIHFSVKCLFGCKNLWNTSNRNKLIWKKWK
jgi:hypothetical protein